MKQTVVFINTRGETHWVSVPERLVAFVKSAFERKGYRIVQ